jgi:sortase A
MNVHVILAPPAARRRSRIIDKVRWTLFAAALGALGYSGYVYLDSAVYQVREEKAFEAKVRQSEAEQPRGPASASPRKDSVIRPKDDDPLIGRIAIPRLHLQAIVAEGVDSKTLRRAVGHVPGTALPGEAGNVGLAGHRDSFFRELREVRKNDRITVETVNENYEYIVESLKVVGPTDVQVLAPTPNQTLTLVTCYPFQYTGNAPRRFVVRARQVTKAPREDEGL